MSHTCQSYSLNFPRIPRKYTFLSEANWNFMLQGARNRIISYLLPRAGITVKILKFGTPQKIALIVLK